MPLSSLVNAFSHLDIPGVSVGRAPHIFRAAKDLALASLANSRLVFFLRLVESLLPDPGRVLDAAGFLVGRADGPLPANR